jgi:dienelactone hydrolase
LTKGGQCILEQLRAGHNLQAIVSFHGVLHSRPRHLSLDRRLTQEEYETEVPRPRNTYNTNTRVLIEHGDADNRDGRDPTSIVEWKAEMDRAGIDWQFHTHSRAPHGFALAEGVWANAYTEAADRRSTLSMLSFFAETWPGVPQYPVPKNACGTVLCRSKI